MCASKAVHAIYFSFMGESGTILLFFYGQFM